MSELVVVGFDGTEEADRVLLKLAGMKKEYLVDLEDAVVVVRDENGKVHLKQSVNLTAIGASSVFSPVVSGVASLACCSSIRSRGLRSAARSVRERVRLRGR